MEDAKNRRNKINMFVTHFVRICLIILFIRGCVVKDHSQDFIIFITLLLTFYPSILEKRFGVYLPSSLQIVITLFIFAAQVLGELNSFYDKFAWWDIMLHTTSGVILGMVGFLFVYLLNEKGNKNINLSPAFVILFAFCFAMTMGVFWEFFEFGADRIFGLNMQKFRLEGQDGLVDTMVDLIVDAVGALLTCIIGSKYIKTRKDVLFNDYFDEWFESERKRNEELKKQKSIDD